jgi:hypothetical protein
MICFELNPRCVQIEIISRSVELRNAIVCRYLNDDHKEGLFFKREKVPIQKKIRNENIRK